jgi:uncharacterized protein YkwD
MPCYVTTRIALLLCALGLVAAVAPATARTARHAPAVSALDAGVLTELNAIRSAHALPLLRLSRPLGTAARRHSSEMLAHAYFEHASPDGSAFWLRVQRFYRETGRGTWSVGENLLWSGGEIDAKEVVRLWMQSPGHRENILTPRWREIGIATVHGENTSGPWGSGTVTLVTADFGVRG